jgi:hypothetical protein
MLLGVGWVKCARASGDGGICHVRKIARRIGRSRAQAARTIGTLAATTEGETRSVTARIGATGGSALLHVHFTDRAWTRPYSSGSLSRLGDGVGGRAAQVRSRTHVVLRPGDIQHRLRRRIGCQALPLIDGRPLAETSAFGERDQSETLKAARILAASGIGILLQSIAPGSQQARRPGPYGLTTRNRVASGDARRASHH